LSPNARNGPANVAPYGALCVPERRKMMQAWADYLDALKAKADVIPLFKKA
jgi:hypothetical protein